MTNPAAQPERGGSVGVDDWDDHWRRYQGSNGENPANVYRRQLIFGVLAEAGAPRRVLDIGSGQGDLLVEVHRHWPTAEVAGVELSAEGIAAAQRKLPEATFLQRNLLDDPEADSALRGWATHAVCSEVIEHVDDPARLLRHASDFLAGGATLVITVPGGPMSAFDRHIGHRVHYTVDSLCQVMEDAGLTVDRVQGSGFPFFNLYRKLVILRGDKLIDEVDTSDGDLNKSTQAVLRGFGLAFKVNRPDTRWGTQIVGVARKP